MCQACLRGLDGEGERCTYDGLEVHHIESLEKDFEKRTDDYNLITLCGNCHEKAEAGILSARKLQEIAIANSKNIPPGS